MMTADKCREKAEECKQLAERAADDAGARAWRQFADSWLTIAKQRTPLDSTPSTAAARRPAELAEKTSSNNKAADFLRSHIASSQQDRATESRKWEEALAFLSSDQRESFET
jgi:hypothetical protein